jgi:transposase
VAELGERGVVTSYGSVWRIVHDAGVSFKSLFKGHLMPVRTMCFCS